MSRPLQYRREARDYLLVPSMPTPNGRLHLGHIAGPFLKLDVLARYLRSRGARAHVVTGVDSYESYVLLQADREQRSPAEVAAAYTQQIVEDLEALHLIQDGFIDPLVSPGKEIYEQCNRLTVNRLLEVGAARYQSRKYPYSTARQRFVPRSLVLGTCRCCGQDTSGSVCEACGRQHAADEVLDPHFRDGDTSAEWREVATLSMRVVDKDGLMQRLGRIALPEKLHTTLATHVERFDAEMELTIPGDWGLRWSGAPDGSSQIVFTYYTYAWALAAGETFRRLTGAARNAFDAASDVVTVLSFGVDVTVAAVFCAAGFAHVDPERKGYDYYLSNEFLRLHGDKFSTSRGHVISGTDLVRKTPATADAIRYYLATISPDDEETDFQVDGFIATNNDVLVEGTWRTVRHALDSLAGAEPEAPSSGFIEAFEDALRVQSDDFDLERFRIGRVPGRVQEWTERLAQAVRLGQDVYWFLKGLTILAGPLVPDFSGRLWRKLGGQGEPDLERFLERTRVQPQPLEPLALTLSMADLRPCLPRTLLESGAPGNGATHACAVAERCRGITSGGNTMFEYIVVGKGLFGAAAARHLSAMAGNVAIIGPDEPEDPSRHEGVFASHYDQGRILRRLSRDIVWSILGHRSYLEYEHLQAESGVRFYHPVDGVHLVPRNKESMFVKAAGELSARLGIDCTVASGRDVVARWPMLGFPDDCYGFIEHAPAGYVNPRELIRAQLALASRHGAAIVRDTVVEIRKSRDFVTVVTGGGQIYEGRKILLSMGAYAKGFDVLPRRLALRVKSETTLLARLGEREAARLAGMPTVAYERDAPPIDTIYMLPPIRYPDGHFYIKMGCNMQADTYLSTASEMNQWVRAGESDTARSVMIDAMRDVIPGLDASSFETKRCLITYTPSVWPYIDRVDEDRVFVATGGNGMGAKACDAIGKLAAALMVNGEWADELDAGCFRAIYEDDIASLGWKPSGMTKPQQLGRT